MCPPSRPMSASPNHRSTTHPPEDPTQSPEEQTSDPSEHHPDARSPRPCDRRSHLRPIGGQRFRPIRPHIRPNCASFRPIFTHFRAITPSMDRIIRWNRAKSSITGRKSGTKHRKRGGNRSGGGAFWYGMMAAPPDAGTGRTSASGLACRGCGGGRTGRTS